MRIVIHSLKNDSAFKVGVREKIADEKNRGLQVSLKHFLF
jgi:hypothetical protein